MHIKKLSPVAQKFILHWGEMGTRWGVNHHRKKREIDPTLQVLQRCIAEAGKPKSADRYTRERLTDLLQFFELAETAYRQLEKLPTSALLKLTKMGDRAARLLGLTKY